MTRRRECFVYFIAEQQKRINGTPALVSHGEIKRLIRKFLIHNRAFIAYWKLLRFCFINENACPNGRRIEQFWRPIYFFFAGIKHLCGTPASLAQTILRLSVLQDAKILFSGHLRKGRQVRSKSPTSKSQTADDSCVGSTIDFTAKCQLQQLIRVTSKMYMYDTVRYMIRIAWRQDNFGYLPFSLWIFSGRFTDDSSSAPKHATLVHYWRVRWALQWSDWAERTSTQHTICLNKQYLRKDYNINLFRCKLSSFNFFLYTYFSYILKMEGKSSGGGVTFCKFHLAQKKMTWLSLTARTKSHHLGRADIHASLGACVWIHGSKQFEWNLGLCW